MRGSTSIDASAALAVDGCVAVLTAEDLTGTARAERRRSPMYPDAMGHPPLARGTVRFVGEPVAVVLTEDRYEGEDLAELVEVDYDPLPVVVDPHEALRGETLLFPEVGTNVARASPTPGARRLRRLRGRGDARRSSTSASPWRHSRCAAAPRCGTPTSGAADHVDPQPGRAGPAGTVAKMLGLPTDAGARDHARRSAARSARSSAPTRSRAGRRVPRVTWTGPSPGWRPARRTWSR